MVNGPDCRICARCIQDAAGMVDEDASDEETPDPACSQPEREVWEAAFDFYEDAPPPLKEQLRSVYGRHVVSNMAYKTSRYLREKKLGVTGCVFLAFRSLLVASYPGWRWN